MAAYAATGTILQACQAAGVSRAGYLKALRLDERFADAVRCARLDAADVLLKVARERGVSHSDRCILGLIRRDDQLLARETPRVVVHQHELGATLQPYAAAIADLLSGALGRRVVQGTALPAPQSPSEPQTDPIPSPQPPDAPQGTPVASPGTSTPPPAVS